MPPSTSGARPGSPIYCEHVAGKLTRPDRVADLLRVVLRFFGARPFGANPKNPPIDGEPYHDLRLGDLFIDPDWILKFEDWMDRRGRAGQTKNQYRSAVSQMYRIAMSKLYRKHTGIRL